MHMSPTETIHFLLLQGDVEPELTRTVWSLLEDQNPAFFEAYYIRLRLKDQIEVLIMNG